MDSLTGGTSSCESCVGLSQRVADLEHQISTLFVKIQEERDVDLILGKTLTSANSAQLADTAQCSAVNASHSASPDPAGAPRPGTNDHKWIQQGARPKAPISSTPVKPNPWITVGPRKQRGKRASCSNSTIDITLGKFNILDHEQFPPPTKKTRTGKPQFTPAPRSDRHAARCTDNSSPPVLGNLHESECDSLAKSPPTTAPPPRGGSASCARGSPAPRRLGASSALSPREQGDIPAPADGQPAPQRQPHVSTVPSASTSRPGPSVLVLGSSMVRHVRVRKGYTSCHPGALVKDIRDSAPSILRHHPTVKAVVIHVATNDLKYQQVSSVSSEEPLHQELWSAVAAGLWLMGPGGLVLTLSPLWALGWCPAAAGGTAPGADSSSDDAAFGPSVPSLCILTLSMFSPDSGPCLVLTLGTSRRPVPEVLRGTNMLPQRRFLSFLLMSCAVILVFSFNMPSTVSWWPSLPLDHYYQHIVNYSRGSVREFRPPPFRVHPYTVLPAPDMKLVFKSPSESEKLPPKPDTSPPNLEDPPSKLENPPPNKENSPPKPEESSSKLDNPPPNKENLNSKPENPPPNKENSPPKPEEPPSNSENPPSNSEKSPPKPDNPPPNPENHPPKSENPPSKPENPPSNPENPPSKPENPPSNPENPPPKPENLPKSDNPPPKSDNPPPKSENPPSKPENAPSKPETPPPEPENPPSKPENPPPKPENPPPKPENPPSNPENPPPKPENPPSKSDNPPPKSENPPPNPENPPSNPENPPPQLENPPSKPENPPPKPENLPKSDNPPPKSENPPSKPENAPSKPENPPPKPENPPPKPENPPSKSDNPPPKSENPPPNPENPPSNPENPPPQLENPPSKPENPPPKPENLPKSDNPPPKSENPPSKPENAPSKPENPPPKPENPPPKPENPPPKPENPPSKSDNPPPKSENPPPNPENPPSKPENPPSNPENPPSKPENPPPKPEEPPSKPENPGSVQFHEAYAPNYHFTVDNPDACKDPPFLVLMVPVAPSNIEARNAIRQTWGKEPVVQGERVMTMFLLGQAGGPGADPQSLEKENSQYHDLIQSDFTDSYLNLTIKTMVIMHWLSIRCTNAIFAMKIDSDMFLNIDNLVDMLKKPEIPRKNYLTGMLMWNRDVLRNKNSKWYVPEEKYPDPKYPTYCLGMGYVFSNDLPVRFVEISKTIKPFNIEDAYVGMCMKKLGLSPTSPPHPGQFKAYATSTIAASSPKLSPTSWAVQSS
ncbi:hypothetical protein WMY93_005482 [Mugilogobius chulae]|uniref:Uncharacterized protein n=1 Tax=Mugilogobius chulae TaxID=88201 RepID=A0AAW0PQW7_9GOBI